MLGPHFLEADMDWRRNSHVVTSAAEVVVSAAEGQSKRAEVLGGVGEEK